MFSSKDLVFCYTREDAIKDGALIDATLHGAEFGFKIPVAITAGVWARCVVVPVGMENEQDERGRLSDLLFLAAQAARSDREASEVRFVGIFKDRPTEEEIEPEPVKLKMLVHPGDYMEPVATILLEHED